MHRLSCFRLRSSTGPKVLMFMAFLLLHCRLCQDTGRNRTAVSALCRRVPTARPRCRTEPPRGFEPLRPGPKPGALPAELRRRDVVERLLEDAVVLVREQDKGNPLDLSMVLQLREGRPERDARGTLDRKPVDARRDGREGNATTT